jgi:hypothetical protein
MGAKEKKEKCSDRLEGGRGERSCVREHMGKCHVAPGVAWGLWHPIFKGLEPALAARLAVSGCGCVCGGGG